MPARRLGVARHRFLASVIRLPHCRLVLEETVESRYVVFLREAMLRLFDHDVHGDRTRSGPAGRENGVGTSA